MSDWAITYSKDEATERQVLPFPHKPSPEEVAEHLLEWAEANLKPGHYSTGKLESDEPAELLLRRFGTPAPGSRGPLPPINACSAKPTNAPAAYLGRWAKRRFCSGHPAPQRSSRAAR